MTDVGFEPTHPKILVPKTSALDHSAIRPIFKLWVFTDLNPCVK